LKFELCKGASGVFAGIEGARLADVCILYAREDRQQAKSLRDALVNAYTVWWDDDLRAGDWRSEVESQISQARCVIPLWSSASRQSPTVIDEVSFAKLHKIHLLPVKLEEVGAPLEFGSLHTVDLSGWDGNPNDGHYQELYRNLSTVLGSRTVAQSRLCEWKIDGKSGELPLFFFSISSFETALTPEAAAEAVALCSPKAALYSAYDVIKAKKRPGSAALTFLERYRSNGGVVALDSGNYEATRKRDKRWNFDAFHKALSLASYDFAFCFDDVLTGGEAPEIAEAVCKAVERDRTFTSQPVIPIVHAPADRSTGQINSALLPRIMQDVCRELHPQLIAVPERELGDGLFTRARAVYEIRQSLDDLGFYQPLHLLGTGNPLSIAIFASVGADSFDGLEWCRTAIDADTGRLYHLQQYDLFSWQTEYATSPIVRESVTQMSLAYPAKVIFHNLDAFSAWMTELREHARARKTDRFLAAKLPDATENLKALGNKVPEVFN
jgi:hypothetical protein